METLVVRGRKETPNADRAATKTLLAHTTETGHPTVRVWTPHRQIAFGRRDTRADGYDRAVSIATEHGFPAIERSVGGRAVAYTGSVLAFASTIPIDDIRQGMDERYETATTQLLTALSDVGATVERGEPADSYCPGEHSIQGRDTGKIVGIAQRITGGAALVSGCVTVTDRDATEIASVLAPVYAAIDVPFNRASVGSVETAGGAAAVEAVQRSIEQTLISGPTAVVDCDSIELDL